MNFVVKDIALADFGCRELDIAETEVPDSNGSLNWERTDLINSLRSAV